MGGRRWTRAEDELVRNAMKGSRPGRPRRGRAGSFRFRILAEAFDRSSKAVRQRAHVLRGRPHRSRPPTGTLPS